MDCANLTSLALCLLLSLLSLASGLGRRIDGRWTAYTEWSEYNTCSLTCGSGSQSRTRSRTCTNPAPSNGGKNCVGDETETEERECNTNNCPVDGGWTQWSEWEDTDECTALCGGGNRDQTRSRTCTNPAPAYGGADCTGDINGQQNIPCNQDACGNRCPGGEVMYIASSTNERRYYQCSNGVAVRHDCAPGTVYDASLPGCKQEARVMASPCPTAFGLFPDPDDCTKYISCVHGNPILMACGPGTRFDAVTGRCDYGTC